MTGLANVLATTPYLWMLQLSPLRLALLIL